MELCRMVAKKYPKILEVFLTFICLLGLRFCQGSEARAQELLLHRTAVILAGVQARKKPFTHDFLRSAQPPGPSTFSESLS